MEERKLTDTKKSGSGRAGTCLGMQEMKGRMAAEIGAP